MVKYKKCLQLLNVVAISLVIVALTSIILMTAAHADIVDPMQNMHTTITHTKNATDTSSTAHAWGLQEEDYKHYQWLMNNTPSGHWYKTLDPAEVLALNADTPNDMMKYAKIQARNMHVRVTRELAFNQLYRKAYKTLYPKEKPIASQTGVTNLDGLTIATGDRVWLFTGIRTPLGSYAYERLLTLVQKTPGTMLDIYFVGNNVTKNTIQTWALRASVPPALVNHTVTLNMGNDRYESLKKSKGTHLPFVGIVSNGKFQPITLNSIIQ